MGCCGKKLVQIAKAKAMSVAGIKYEQTDARVRTCQKCSDSTWMTWTEYWTWIDEHGGRLKYFKEINDLAAWEPLPDQENTRGRKLFCRICKCFMPDKARLKNETCPADRWPDYKGVKYNGG